MLCEAAKNFRGTSIEFAGDGGPNFCLLIHYRREFKTHLKRLIFNQFSLLTPANRDYYHHLLLTNVLKLLLFKNSKIISICYHQDRTFLTLPAKF